MSEQEKVKAILQLFPQIYDSQLIQLRKILNRAEESGYKKGYHDGVRVQQNREKNKQESLNL